MDVQHKYTQLGWCLCFSESVFIFICNGLCQINTVLLDFSAAFQPECQAMLIYTAGVADIALD